MKSVRKIRVNLYRRTPPYPFANVRLASLVTVFSLAVASLYWVTYKKL